MKLTDKVTFRENLRCKLTEPEVLVFARRLAQANKEVEEIETRKKQINDDLKAQTSKHEADIQICGTRVRDGYEFREVECHWEVDNSTDPPRSKFLVRHDTGETVRTVTLSAEELADLSQMDLPVVDPPLEFPPPEKK